MRGFSLIEIIITIALFGVVAGFGLFMSMGALRGAYHRSERDTIVSVLQKARSRAMANLDESAWSVCYLSADNEYAIAKSSTCNDSTAVDRIGANDVVANASHFASTFPTYSFAQLTGNASPAGVITVSEPGRDDELITINHEGTILW